MNPNETAPDEPGVAQRRSSLWRTGLSLLAFIAVYYWLFKSWLAVGVLVAVILIHEAGHFIAMKLLGYESLNMTFIPFVGAYVSGRSMDLSRKKKLMVLMAGPFPGILIGSAAMVLYGISRNEVIIQIAAPFLLLNLFNLLPVYPLDGGQYFQALFFSGSRWIQLFFLYASIAVLIYLFFSMKSAWFLVVLVALIVRRIVAIHQVMRLQEKLSQAGIDYACSYDDLTDEEYAAIRNVLIQNSRRLAEKFQPDEENPDEQYMIRQVEKLLVAPYSDALTAREKLLFLVWWLGGLLLPLLAWLLLYRSTLP